MSFDLKPFTIIYPHTSLGCTVCLDPCGVATGAMMPLCGYSACGCTHYVLGTWAEYISTALLCCVSCLSSTSLCPSTDSAFAGVPVHSATGGAAQTTGQGSQDGSDDPKVLDAVRTACRRERPPPPNPHSALPTGRLSCPLPSLPCALQSSLLHCAPCAETEDFAGNSCETSVML